VQNYAGCAAAVDKFLAVTDKISSERRAKVLLLRGRANLNLQKLDAARADANSGIELHTDDVNESRLFYLRGDVEFAAKNFHEAKNNYNIVVTLGPFDEVAAEAYRKLIGILEELGEKDLANTKRAEYKQKYPNGPEAK
jgi:outer membrane protein assembly factor BamD (BamD/ComL family)